MLLISFTMLNTLYHPEQRGPTVAVGDTAFDLLEATGALSLHTCIVVSVGSYVNSNMQCTSPLAGR